MERVELHHQRRRYSRRFHFHDFNRCINDAKIGKMRVFNDMVAQIMENIYQGGSISSSVLGTYEGGHTFSKRVKYIIKWVPKVYVRLDINLISLE